MSTERRTDLHFHIAIDGFSKDLYGLDVLYISSSRLFLHIGAAVR
jgi:hypothetical protein